MFGGIIMALFSKKKVEEKNAKAAPAKKSAATKPAESKAAPVKKSSTGAKQMPVAKAIAEASASKATTQKPASKASAPKASAKNTTAAKSAPKPFFITGKDDIKELFDKAIAEADYEILKNGAKTAGKYEFELEVDGYHFYLIANNGQILFDSPSFTSLAGALGGIKTFKKAVSEGTFEVKGDKYNRYRFILERKYYGENYTTKDQCAKCVESVKKFANNSKIVRYVPDKDAVRDFELAKNNKRTAEDVDWKAIEAMEKKASKLGKFELVKEDDDHYCFYLLANNGQILYASRYYSTEAAARKGVDSFKRAAYVGNFFVDRDKFGHYRYVLKNIGSAPNFIGESYDNKPQCEKIIDSVKNFIVTASVEMDNE